MNKVDVQISLTDEEVVALELMALAMTDIGPGEWSTGDAVHCAIYHYMDRNKVTGEPGNYRIVEERWQGLQDLGAKFLVDMLTWVSFKDAARGREVHPDERTLINAILRESERRGWPEDWWEDPGVIPEIDLGTAATEQPSPK